MRAVIEECRTEHAMPRNCTFVGVSDVEGDIVQPPIHLAWLDPQRAPDIGVPPAARLMWRLVDVAAAAEQRLILLDEARQRWTAQFSRGSWEMGIGGITGE